LKTKLFKKLKGICQNLARSAENNRTHGIKNIWPRLKNIVYNSQKVLIVGIFLFEIADGAFLNFQAFTKQL
jgi:hypothetical protein